MAHPHEILDTDVHFKINPITREISSESSKVTLIQYDHDSERFTFEIPKFVEGHDMSLSDSIRVHYINISSNGNDREAGVYEATDAQIYENEGEETLVFSWLVSRNATKFSGTLNFAVRFNCTENEEIIYSWGTGIFKGIYISNSLNSSEVIADDYPDILEEWRKDLYSKIDAVNERFNNVVAPEIPTTLPNPNPLNFVGAVDVSYDGTAQTTVEIPSPPVALKNPNPLKMIIGSETVAYDGETEVEVNVADSLPKYTEVDYGKVLSISNDGSIVWKDSSNQTDEYINYLIDKKLEQIPLAEEVEF